MKYWSRFPVFRILIPFAAGIITAIYFEISILTWSITTLVALLIAFQFALRNYATGKYAQRWLAGIPFYTCFFGLGICILWLNKPINYSNHFSFEKSECYFTVMVTEPPVKTKSGYRVKTVVQNQQIEGVWHGCRGNLLLYIHDSSGTFNASRNDILLVKCKPISIPPAMNPNAFDYRKYLESKGINYQSFLESHAIYTLEKSYNFSIFRLADQLRTHLLNNLETHLSGRDQLGVAGALLLGYEEWLDPELESQYSAAGVLHILCVSGMHVGLVYIIFSWLLQWMSFRKWMKKLRFPILIAFVWFYAMLTGLSPSVIRAATMLSFVIAGQWLDKNSNIYNSLCASCVMMFTFDPYLIVSAGFQLSFLAVCGIVTFHKLIFPLWSAPNNFLHKVWELISISISAQLTTFPLSLLLFHQFPNYFIVANLILIPLSTLVMYCGIGLMVFGWIPYLGKFLGIITANSIDLLNYLVVFISKLPGSLTENVSINFTEALLIYLIMLSFTVWLLVKTRTWLFTFQVVVIIFLSSRIFNYNDSSKSNIFTVYSMKNGSLYAVIQNKKAQIFAEADSKASQWSYALSGHFNKNMVTDTSVFWLQPNMIVNLPNQKITLVKNWKRNFSPAQELRGEKINLLVLSGKIEVKADTILKYFNTENIVFDSGFLPNSFNNLKAALLKKGINVYEVKKEGAFICEL
jgi:competence protein ComEC